MTNTLKAESEGFMIALQDQVVATRSQTALIRGNQNPTVCRKCSLFTETVPQIESGC